MVRSLPASDLERWDGIDLSRITPCIIERITYLTTSIHDMMKSSLPEDCGEASGHVPSSGVKPQARMP